MLYLGIMDVTLRSGESRRLPPTDAGFAPSCLDLSRAFLLALALLALTAGRASADVCELMDRTTAERVAAILRAAGTLVHDDWFNPVAVQTVEVRADGNLYVVVVNDTFVPDAAYVYVPGDAGTYRAIGPEAGCEGVDVAPVVPAVPFVVDSGAPSTPPGAAVPRLFGVVEVPRAYEAYLAMGELTEPVALRSAPDAAAGFAAEAATLEAFEMVEVNYDVVGAAVYAVVDGWYLVGLADGAPAWLAPAEAGTFHAFPEMLVESLSFVAEAWDGRLHDTPAYQAPRLRLDAAWRAMMGDDIVVDVREVRVVAGEPWLRLDVIWPGPCDGEETAAIGSGWVPTYATSGAANVWYYSRGC